MAPTLLWLLVAASTVTGLHAFSLFAANNNHQNTLEGRRTTTTLSSSTGSGSSSGSNGSTEATTATTTPRRTVVSCPVTLDEMIRQVVSATQEAAERLGQNRQIVRILVPRDANSGDFGTFLEAASSTDNNSMGGRGPVVLVPPDESWQGGIMQLYRAVSPVATELLRRWSVATSLSGLPDRVVEDRSVDESGVDGVGRLSLSSSSSSSGTNENSGIVCYVQPTQETVADYILSSSSSSQSENDASTTILLLNPQWRQVSDALDVASAGDGLFSGLANFLGGKGGTLKRLDTAGYRPIYTLEGYVCRGNNVRLLQVLDSEWTVFCERGDNDNYVRVGQTSATARPTYQQVEAMLQESDIGFKYARDIGLERK